MSAPVEAPPPPAIVPPGPPPNPRARRRRLLYLIGLLPLLLALALTVKVATMTSHDNDGSTAFADGDGATALEEFAANRSLNWFEPWIAHFDTGNAAFLLKDFDRAIGLFHQALDSVPHEDECTVRINLALTHEAAGDAAVKDGDGEAARNAWEDGITVLTDGKCPTDAGRGEKQSDDATTVKERLENKLDPPQNEQQPQNQQDPQNQQGDQQPNDNQSPQQKEQERKSQQLEERNRQGSKDRRDYQDKQDYENFGYEYQW